MHPRPLESGGPRIEGRKPPISLLDGVRIQRFPRPTHGRFQHVVESLVPQQFFWVDVSTDNRIFKVVHRIRNVIREIHDLSLNRHHLLGNPLPEPLEDFSIFLVDPKFQPVLPLRNGVSDKPRVFARRI